jgi:glutathione S-transferase
LQYIGVFEDIRGHLVPALTLSDEDKQGQLVMMTSEGGAVYALLARLEAGFSTPYLCGEKLTLADIWGFWMLTFMKCGYWQGLPVSFLDPFPKLCELCLTVKSLPVLQEYFMERVAAGGDLYSEFLADI